MSTGHILLLGAIAGATIFLGLPMGRVRGLSANTRSGLSAFATGILVFLLWDVLTNAVDPIEAALHAHRWGRFIGLALHNATEGFGICGPLTGEGIRPTWKLLALLGVIGGAPTFLGTVVGQAWSSDAVSVVFFTVAAGSILYVVGELFAVNRRYGHPVLVSWLMLLGIVAGFATDFIVTAAGV